MKDDPSEEKIMNEKIKIYPGEKVYFDAFLCGWVKAIYIEKVIDLDNHTRIKIRVTSRKNKYYKCGEYVEGYPDDVIPRQCYHRTGLFRYCVYPDYEFINNAE